MSTHEKNYWDEAHETACAQKQDFYIDPQSGLMVATRHKLLSNGFCCQSGCRHCPYGFVNNKEDLF